MMTGTQRPCADLLFQEHEANAANASIREAEIASANPLMNLQAALGQGASSSSAGSFAVKKRWDDGTSSGYKGR